MDQLGRYACPHCSFEYQDKAAALSGNSISLGKTGTKTVELTLLVGPEWMKGSPGKSADGLDYGGSAHDDEQTTRRWNEERSKCLTLLEIRGQLPEEITTANGILRLSEEGGGNIPKRSHFICRQETCGLAQDVLASVKRSGKPGPIASYAIQGYCPECDKKGDILGGKFFDAPSARTINAAFREWKLRSEGDLSSFWPRTPILVGDEIGNHDVNGHMYRYWWNLFNARQLLVHSLILKSLSESTSYSRDVTDALLGVFQQYLRNQNMFCFWNPQRALEPMFSDNHLGATRLAATLA